MRNAAKMLPNSPAATPDPSSNALDGPPSFDIVNIDPTGQAFIEERAAHEMQLRLHFGDALIGAGPAPARGEWVVVENQPPAPGMRQLAIEATSRATGVTRRS